MNKKDWRWKTLDGLEMYSVEWVPDGEIKGVVVLIHGLGEHVNRYEHVALAFTQRGYALAGFDLRGHGRSGGLRGHTPSMEIYFRDIDDFLIQMGRHFPGAPTFLYGHSMGGGLILAYASNCQSRISGVIATGPAIYTAIQEQPAKVFLVNLLGSVLPNLTIKSGLDPNNISRDPAVVKAYVSDPLVHNKLTTRFGKSMLYLHDTALKSAPNFPTRALIMHGSGDRLSYPRGSQEWVELAPRDKVTLKMWEGLFHEIHNEPEKDQVIESMLDWLDTF